MLQPPAPGVPRRAPRSRPRPLNAGSKGGIFDIEENERPSSPEKRVCCSIDTAISPHGLKETPFPVLRECSLHQARSGTGSSAGRLIPRRYLHDFLKKNSNQRSRRLRFAELGGDTGCLALASAAFSCWLKKWPASLFRRIHP